jgi:replicative DNA helicase
MLETYGKLSASKIWIEDTPGISYLDMRAIARRLKAKEGLDFILIDYLQLIALPKGRKETNRQEAVAEISRNLKIIARELKVPVMALSQLSRSLESRSDKEPILSDLRESGAIEQDADVVAFIHRPGYFNKDDESLRNLAEIIIAKQRNGPIGKVKLTFIDKYTRFEDLYEEKS